MNRQKIKLCPILHPTMKEFSNFYEYVQKIEKQYKKHYGIVKIVPPNQWISKSLDYKQKLKNLIIKRTIVQNTIGQKGLFQARSKIGASFSFGQYKKQALKLQKQIAKIQDPFEIEKKFWKQFGNKEGPAPLYCPDVDLTLMDQFSKQWNLNKLGSFFQFCVKQFIKGLNSPYLFVGSWKTFFSWHIQDLDLSAINLHHQGKAKVWYGIHSDDKHLFEKFAKENFPEEKCEDFLRHKSTIINPYLLKEKYPQIRISKMFQEKNQISIAFSHAYHSGFNSGFNIAQAVNYATPDWLQKIYKYKTCKCKTISLDLEFDEMVQNIKSSEIYGKIKNNLYFKKIQDKAKKIQDKLKRQAKLQKKQQQNFKDMDKTEFQRQLNLKIQKNKRIKKRQKEPIKKLKLDKIGYSINLEVQIQCNICKMWRLVSNETCQKYSKRSFVCKDINKKCLKKYQREEKAKAESVQVQKIDEEQI